MPFSYGNHHRLSLPLFLLLGILLMSTVPRRAQTPYQVQKGDIEGAQYAIAVPEEWNGRLLLIAHGLRPDDAPKDPGLNPEYPPYRYLLEEGWMIAATGYRRNGVIVMDAIEDLDRLRELIIRQHGAPDRVLIDGSSMGGAIATLIAETREDAYQGALARGAALGVNDPRHPFRLTSMPRIPLLFLSNQSEMDMVRLYAERSSGASVIPAVWEVKRDGHVNINAREHEAALRALDQFVDTGDIERVRDATMPTPPSVSSAEFKDGGAYGRIKAISEDFGNINTDMIEADLLKLGISRRAAFTITYGDKTVKAVLGTTYGDVPTGEWVGFIDWEGFLRLARNFENAARTLGCKEGDRLFVKIDD